MKIWHIFDLDGTLVDSMPYFRRGILQVLDDDGIPYGPDMADILTPLGYTKSAQLYQTMGVAGTVEEIVARFMEILHHAYANDVPLKSGVADYLRTLKAEGKRLCVLTGSPHLLTDVCLQRNGLWELFDHVWSVDDFGISKDNPDIYHEITRLLDCAPSAITLYDDNLAACTTAASCGWYTVGVRDRQKAEVWAQLQQTAHRSVVDFAEV